MQSLVTLAAKIVAKSFPAERMYNLPIELRERLQIYYNKEIQIEHFATWKVIWKYLNVRYLVVVTYQDKYTNILVYGKTDLIVELNLYDNKLHGINTVVYKGVCKNKHQHVYKLGRQLSLTVYHEDGSLRCAQDFTKYVDHEIIEFKSGGNGEILCYAYYSRSLTEYVELIYDGNNVRHTTPVWSWERLECLNWVQSLLKSCDIYIEVP